MATCPSKRIAAPDTKGTFAATQAAFTANRVVKLSQQSTTTSTLAICSASDSASKACAIQVICTWGFNARKVCAAFEQDSTGLVVVDGELIELPVVRSMYRVLAIAKRIDEQDAHNAR